MEFIIIGVILLFIFMYRVNKGENVYKFIVKQVGVAYDMYAPYSFKVMREKVKELGQEYTVRQYTVQVVVFAGIASVVGYLYNYNLIKYYRFPAPARYAGTPVSGKTCKYGAILLPKHRFPHPGTAANVRSFPENPSVLESAPFHFGRVL